MDDKQSKDKQPLDRYLQVYTRDEVKVFFDRAVTELERRDQAAKKRKDRYWLWGFIGALAVIVAVVLGIKLSGQTIADKAQQLVVNNPQYKVIPQGEAPGLYPNMLPIPGGEMVMMEQGDCLIEQGQLVPAEVLYSQCIEQAESFGDLRGSAIAQTQRSSIYSMMERPADALRGYESALEVFETLDDEVMAIQYARVLSSSVISEPTVRISFGP